MASPDAAALSREPQSPVWLEKAAVPHRQLEGFPQAGVTPSADPSHLTLYICKIYNLQL